MYPVSHYIGAKIAAKYEFISDTQYYTITTDRLKF